MIGIYKITNILNNKVYIGQSSDIDSRWQQHKHSLINSNKSWYPEARKESNSINDFIFTVIQECKIEELDELEEYWINYYNAYNNGYNKTIDGQGTIIGIKLLSDSSTNGYNKNNIYQISLDMFKKVNEKIPGKNGNERALLLFLILQEQTKNSYLSEQLILDSCVMVHSNYSECRKRLVEKRLIEYRPREYIKILYENIMK